MSIKLLLLYILGMNLGSNDGDNKDLKSLNREKQEQQMRVYFYKTLSRDLLNGKQVTDCWKETNKKYLEAKNNQRYK